MVEGAQLNGTAAGQQKPDIKIRPDSSVQGIANLITSSIFEDHRITLRAIGAGALNQALKGTIQARQYLAGQGEDLVLRPGFKTIKGNDGSDITAVVLHCTLDHHG
jgi:stage V sporulation protein S